MNGASISSKATEFTAHINSKDIDLYIAKLNRLNITYSYNALGVLLTCINIYTDRVPDLQYPDMYVSQTGDVQCCTAPPRGARQFLSCAQMMCVNVQKVGFQENNLPFKQTNPYKNQ